MSENNQIYDLMYCGHWETANEVQSMIAADHPTFTFEDASDLVHPGRIVVKGEISDEDWYLYVMRKGIHTLSFMWELERMDKPDRMRPLIQMVVDEQKQEPAP